MRRTNHYFNKRKKVRNSVEDRLVYMEKLNDILIRTTNAQTLVNKELRGKQEGIVNQLRKLRDRIDDILSADRDTSKMHHELIHDVADSVESLASKVDVMEEVLEDLV